MNKEKQMKAEKAVDKMLGVNRLYITLSSPLILGEGDRIIVTGRMGKDGEIMAGSIQISRDFSDTPYGGHAVWPSGIGTPTTDSNVKMPSNPTKRIGGRGVA